MKHVALIGGGKWGMNLARNFHQLGALAYICDTNEKRLKELEPSFPGVTLVSSPDAFLGDPDVSGVAVATPPLHHYEVAVKVIESGRHLFIEKPMTLDVEESRRLNAMARQRGIILMVGHILLYNPAYMKLREIIEHGELGELCHIQAQRIGLGRVRREEDALFSLAPHDISVLLYLFGDTPEALSCFGMDFLQKGIMDCASLNLRFPGKRIGQINVSWFSPEKVRQHTVVGTKKMARVDEMIGKGVLKLFDRHVEAQTLAIHEGEEILVDLPDHEPLKEECRHFLSCMESGQTPRSDGSQGLAVVSILDTARRSALLRGEWLAIPGLC